MRWDTAWMMASWARHLDTRRRRTSPTAIGRRPPFFFLQASKEAPQKWGRTDCGVRPEASRLTNFVKAKRDSRDLSAEGHSTASRTWVGRRPEGPGAEPDGKDFTLFFTADSEIVGGVGAGPAGRVAGGT